MSEGNVDIVRASLSAYNRGDLEAATAGAAADCVFDWSRSIGPQRGVYRLDQLHDLNIAGAFESVRFEPQELIEAADSVITPLVGHFRGRDGIDVTARFTFLWTFREGDCIRVTLYQEREHALTAVGLAE